MRIFPSGPMDATIFAEGVRSRPAFREAGIVFADRPDEADLIVARREHSLRKFTLSRKPLVVWTHEPRFSLAQTSPYPAVRMFGRRVHAINLYTSAVYSCHFHHFRHIRIDFDRHMAAFRSKPRRAVFLAGYRKRPRKVRWRGQNVDLIPLRQELALTLRARGICDVFGNNWPGDIKPAGDRYGGGWRSSKLDVLKGYRVNIALENTNLPYYTTEKIWDAIQGACLPVYHSGINPIHELFPKDSFLDSTGLSVDELADRIAGLSDSEAEERFALCARAYIEHTGPEHAENALRSMEQHAIRELMAIHERSSARQKSTQAAG